MSGFQSGSTLLVSLIILLVLTIVGISSVGNVTLNQKMATNYRDADVAFQAAEAALAEGESMAEALGAVLTEDDFGNSCGSGDCFTDVCSDGKCFNGTYTPASVCEIDEPTTLVYENPLTWSTSGRARDSQLSFPGLSESPKFIVEFLCYVVANPSAPAPPAPPPYPAVSWSYFFRITSYARGANDASRVMLQSTYKVDRT